MKIVIPTAQHPALEAIKNLSTQDKNAFLEGYKANLLELCQDLQKAVKQLRQCFKHQEDKDLIVLQISTSLNQNKIPVFDDLVIKTPDLNLEVYFKRILGVLEDFSYSSAITPPDYNEAFEEASKRLVQAQLYEFNTMQAIIANQVIQISYNDIKIDLKENEITENDVVFFSTQFENTRA